MKQQGLIDCGFKVERITTDAVVENVSEQYPVRKQKGLTDCGFKIGRITTDGVVEDVSEQYPVRKRGDYTVKEYIPLKDRKPFCDSLFKNNEKSDEYYTRGESWNHFLKLYGLVGEDVYECFYGDGSSKIALEGMVNVKGDNRNFWEQYTDPLYAGLLVLSNPPFSWKYQLIQTLLEQKRDFALILPWQTFYGDCPLEGYKKRWGGDYIIHRMTAKEQMFYHPTQGGDDLNGGQMIQIGTMILYWRQDGIFKTDVCYSQWYENNKSRTER